MCLRLQLGENMHADSEAHGTGDSARVDSDSADAAGCAPNASDAWTQR